MKKIDYVKPYRVGVCSLCNGVGVYSQPTILGNKAEAKCYRCNGDGKRFSIPEMRFVPCDPGESSSQWHPGSPARTALVVPMVEGGDDFDRWASDSMVISEVSLQWGCDESPFDRDDADQLARMFAACGEMYHALTEILAGNGDPKGLAAMGLRAFSDDDPLNDEK